MSRNDYLDDVSPELIERLRDLGDHYGPLGVALTAAGLTRAESLIAAIHEIEARRSPDPTPDPTPERVTLILPDGTRVTFDAVVTK